MADELPESVARVFDHVAGFIKETIDSSSLEERQLAGAAAFDQLFGRTSKHPKKRNMSELEAHKSRIAHSLLDLLDSYFKLFNFEIYLRRFPFGNTSIARHDYLEHCIEGYLHGVYVFEERHKRFVNSVSAYNRQQHGKSAQDLGLDKVIKATKRALKGLTRVRGQHVHEFRYCDERVSRLVMIHLLSNSSELGKLAPVLKGMYNQVFSETRRHWVDLARTNNSSVKVLLEATCTIIEKYLPPKHT